MTRPAPCTTAMLQLSTVPADGAGGHAMVRLVFTNTSGRTCTLRGYPGVDMVRDGASIHAARSTVGYFPVPSRVTTVVLAPHQRAHAVVQGATGNTTATHPGRCSTTMTVTVPDMTRTTRIPSHLGSCAHLTVSPVTKG